MSDATPVNGEGAGGQDGRTELPWQRTLRLHLEGLEADEIDALRAGAIRSLDRATRARGLEIADLARLSALADYLAPQIEKRPGDRPPAIADAVLLGLPAGYQLAVGEQAPQEPDPFAE